MADKIDYFLITEAYHRALDKRYSKVGFFLI